MIVKKIKICILGADGQVGKEFRNLHQSYEYMSFDFFSKTDCDITNEESVKTALNIEEYDYVINCAAYTAVDKAESDQEKCFLINAAACKYICNAILGRPIRLVHFSSDYVYHTFNGFPLRETDSTEPVGIYAQSKLEGENTIRACAVEALILRTSWVVSSFGHNFVKTMLGLGKEKSELRVVNDQLGTITYARHLAVAVLDIITSMTSEHVDKDIFNQTYNFSSEGITSWYDIANEIMKGAELNCRVLPVSTSAYPTAAVRPQWSVMAKNKIREAFGLEIPHWHKALKECMEAIKTQGEISDIKS
jgi:dTDP-4-dehydrorhamnose reductase